MSANQLDHRKLLAKLNRLPGLMRRKDKGMSVLERDTQPGFLVVVEVVQ